MEPVVRQTSSPRRVGPLRRAGFNFSEVLFAVMILGIGFIMIAAIFPVALQQTRQTGEEVVASTSARSGVNFMQQAGAMPEIVGLPKILPQTVSSYVPPNPATGGNDLLLAPGAAPQAGIPLKLPGRVFSFRDDRFVDATGAADPYTRDRLWSQISANLILPSDNRLAWVCMYKRGATFTSVDGVQHKHSEVPFTTDSSGVVTKHIDVHPDGFIQVFVFAVQTRGRPLYDARDLQRYTGGNPTVGPAATGLPPATLEPRTVFVKLIEGDGTRGAATADTRDELWFYDGPTAAARLVDVPAADEGAFIIISDDQYPGDDPGGTATRTSEANGAANGRIYRLGERLTNPDGSPAAGKWALAPGWDMDYQNPDGTVGNADDVHQQIPPNAVRTTSPPGEPGGLPAYAFLVGRAYADPTNPFVSTAVPGAGYEGRVQDIYVYTSFVPAN